MSVVECPYCFGEGFCLYEVLDSRYPALLECDACDRGDAEQPVYCVKCETHISGILIDLLDDGHRELVEFNKCNRCINIDFGTESGNSSIVTFTGTNTGTITWEFPTWNQTGFVV